MTLDTQTLAVLSGLIVTLCGVTFILNTTLRRNDPVGRIWSVAFVGGILQTLAYTVVALSPGAWWALAVGNAAFVIALGMMWVGFRLANDRRSLLWVPPLVGAVVAFAVVVRGPDAGEWAGAIEMFLAVAAFGAFAALETVTGQMQPNINARTLTIVFTIIAPYYLARIVGITLLGPEDETFQSYFGPVPTTLINLSLVVLGTVSLSIIQAERFGARGRVDVVSEVESLDGITGPHLFHQLAESWLLRSVRERSILVLILFDLANLEEINVAFGRAAGDRAVRLVGRVVATQAPAAALVGHLAPARFAVLMPLTAAEEVGAVADRITGSILNSPLDDSDRFRASAFFGTASTRTSGSRFKGLLEAAEAEVAEATRDGSLDDSPESVASVRWRS